MNLKITNKYKWLIIFVLVLSTGVLFFFYHFYHKDIKALTDFLASYGRFDKAISDFSMSKTDDLESEAGDALVELNTIASFRLSSLIKNDGELMGQALEVAGLSGRELESLRAYKRGIQYQNADLDGLAKAYGVLTSKRKAAYARFQELGGIN